MKKLTLFLCVASVLAGCGEGSEPVHLVDWYKSHEAERKAMIAKCESNPGELLATPNCINATRANNDLAFEKRALFSEKPKIDLSKNWKSK